MYEYNTFDPLIKCMAVQQNDEWDTSNKERKFLFHYSKNNLSKTTTCFLSSFFFLQPKKLKVKWQSCADQSKKLLISDYCQITAHFLQNSCFEVQEIGPTVPVRPLFTGLIKNRHLDRSISSDPINSICRFDRIDGLDRPVDNRPLGSHLAAGF